MVFLRITQITCRQSVMKQPAATPGYIVVRSLTIVHAAFAVRGACKSTNTEGWDEKSDQKIHVDHRLLGRYTSRKWRQFIPNVCRLPILAELLEYTSLLTLELDLIFAPFLFLCTSQYEHGTARFVKAVRFAPLETLTDMVRTMIKPEQHPPAELLCHTSESQQLDLLPTSADHLMLWSP